LLKKSLADSSKIYRSILYVYDKYAKLTGKTATNSKNFEKPGIRRRAKWAKAKTPMRPT